jgi:tetratricopeptide (TPR) repeat protein
MSRWVACLIFAVAACALAQNGPPPPPLPQPPAKTQDTSKPPDLKRDRPAQATSDQEEVPPEEDKSLTHEDYSFNPMQSQRDLTVGDEYRKKGNLTAAASRYVSATKYNEGNALAWYKLGETRQKLKDVDGAKQAYSKYLELDGTSKTAEEVRKTLTKLK